MLWYEYECETVDEMEKKQTEQINAHKQVLALRAQKKGSNYKI